MYIILFAPLLYALSVGEEDEEGQVYKLIRDLVQFSRSRPNSSLVSVPGVFALAPNVVRKFLRLVGGSSLSLVHSKHVMVIVTVFSALCGDQAVSNHSMVT